VYTRHARAENTFEREGKNFMRRIYLGLALAIAILIWAGAGLAQQAASGGPYKVLKTAKVGGDGGFDYDGADNGV
jgi:hypothetical protein